MQRFRGGLVFKAHRLLCHSTLGLRVIKKKGWGFGSAGFGDWGFGVGVSGVGFRGLRFGAWGLGVGVWGSEFHGTMNKFKNHEIGKGQKEEGLEFEVWGMGCRGTSLIRTRTPP